MHVAVSVRPQPDQADADQDDGRERLHDLVRGQVEQHANREHDRRAPAAVPGRAITTGRPWMCTVVEQRARGRVRAVDHAGSHEPPPIRSEVFVRHPGGDVDRQAGVHWQWHDRSKLGRDAERHLAVVSSGVDSRLGDGTSQPGRDQQPGTGHALRWGPVLLRRQTGTVLRSRDEHVARVEVERHLQHAEHQRQQQREMSAQTRPGPGPDGPTRNASARLRLAG